MAKERSDDVLSRNLAANLVAMRRARNYSQSALASAAGLPRSTVSSAESGQANPSLVTLNRLASALSVSLDELVSPPRSLVHLIRSGDIPVVERSEGRVRIAKLLPDRVRGLEIDRMTLSPGATMRGTPHVDGTKEYLHVVSGTVQVLLGGEFHAVEEGDVLAFAGNQSHSYRNPTRSEATAFSVVIPFVAGGR